MESYSLGVVYEYQGRNGAALQSHEEAVKTLRDLKESGFWLGAILGHTEAHSVRRAEPRTQIKF